MNDQMSKSSSDRMGCLCARHCGRSTAVPYNTSARVESASYSQESCGDGSQDPQKGGRKTEPLGAGLIGTGPLSADIWGSWPP